MRSNKFHYVIFRFNTSTDTRYTGETNLTFCTAYIYIVICVLNAKLRLNTSSVALTSCGVCVRDSITLNRPYESTAAVNMR